MNINKKGQLGVYLIIGMLILIVVLILSTSKSDYPEEMTLSASALPVQNFITSCIKEKLEYVVNVMGNQGGYINIPSNVAVISTELTEIPFWYYSGLHIVNKKDAESTIEAYLTKEVYACAEALETDIEADSASADVQITLEGVYANVKLPLSVEIANKVELFESYYAEIGAPLGEMMNDAAIVSAQVQNDEGNDLGLVGGFNYNSTIYDVTANDKIIAFDDGKYSFIFAVRLDDDSGNRAPIMSEVPLVNVTIGDVVDVKINAIDPDGDSLSYTIISSKFDIEEDGRVRFVADSVGEFSYYVYVEDPEGNSDFGLLVVRVNPI